jgi:hypothetical protein
MGFDHIEIPFTAGSWFRLPAGLTPEQPHAGLVRQFHNAQNRSYGAQ